MIHWRTTGLVVLLFVALADCTREEAPVVPATPTQVPLAAVPALATAPPREGLPRVVGAVKLGMGRPDVEGQLGGLDCHPTPDGLDVCRPKDAARGEGGLEVYFYHDAVISLAYEIPLPRDVFGHLEALSQRYGNPSLKGLTERDRTGRLHEVYGWRDTDSLYSIRFVYEESETQPRRLAGATVTLWDRAAYAAWEKDTERRNAAPRAAT